MLFIGRVEGLVVYHTWFHPCKQILQNTLADTVFSNIVCYKFHLFQTTYRPKCFYIAGNMNFGYNWLYKYKLYQCKKIRWIQRFMHLNVCQFSDTYILCSSICNQMRLLRPVVSTPAFNTGRHGFKSL